MATIDKCSTTIATIETLLGDPSRDQVSYAHLADAVCAHNSLDQIGAIKCPTLIMAGRLDP